ncbi:MAG: RHS repeat protein [Treponema sp.]|nr:RHS repeat protein [Treponema sp.]
MEELYRKPTKKEFFVRGNKVTKKVSLLKFTAYNRNGKPTIEEDLFYKCKTLFDYDSLGNEIHTSNSFGLETWTEYDSSENPIHKKNSSEEEIWFEYDNNGNCIYLKDEKGFEGEFRYNERNQKFYQYGTRFEIVTLYQYDKDNRLIRDMDSNGYVTKYTYNQDGRLMLEVSSSGLIKYYEYDSKGNILYFASGEIDDDIDVENFELDFTNIKMSEFFYEYEFYPNGKVQKMYEYETCEE